ncbi:MAG TPA: hypothetical protein VF128_09795 [Gemmatimonadaceae bacterium]
MGGFQDSQDEAARRVVLDSSMVGDLARDFFDPKSPAHQEARALVDFLTSETSAWIPTLSAMHVNEIAQHSDARVVEQRIAFLERLPRIAWLRNTEQNNESTSPYLGSVLDLIYGEGIAWRPGVTACILCASLRDSTFFVATDPSYLGDLVWSIAESRQRLGSLNQARRLASVTYAIQREATHFTVGQVRTRMTRDPELIQGRLHARFARMAERLHKTADPRALGSESLLAQQFAAMGGDTARYLSATDRDPFTAWLASQGLDPSHVQDSDTVQDVADLAAFRARWAMICETRLVALSSERAKALRPWMIPSARVDNLVRHYQIQTADRPSGSDLLDASIAPMALYADVVFVDKRTQDLLRRIRRAHPDLDSALCRIVRWSVPAKALAALSKP